MRSIPSVLRLSVLTCFLSLFATACGGGDDPAPVDTTEPTTLDAAAANAAAGFEPVTADPPLVFEGTGRHGGRLTWSVIGELTSFNDLVEDSVTGADLATLPFEALVRFDRGAWETKPLLAHKWEKSDDHLTYTFHLRKGVKFSDGEAFDADDVMFSFEAAFHPKIANSAKSLFQVGDAGLPRAERVDDHTVRFTLEAPNVLFLEAVGSIQIYPEHKWGETLDAENPSFAEKMKPGDIADVVGTGPYIPVSYKGAEAISYRRNPYHWRTDSNGLRLPYADEVVVLIVADLNTQAEQFLNGKFDLMNSVQPPDVTRFRKEAKSGKIRIHRLGVSLSTAWLTVNLDPGKDAEGQPFVEPRKLKIFQDARFRKALSHATNRPELVKLFLDGKGKPVYSQTSEGNQAWYQEHTTYPYDPAKARALLDEMGLTKTNADGIRLDAEGKPVTIELTTNVENNIRVKCISRIKEDWRAVGIGATTRPIAFNELVSALQDGRKFECILLGWGSGVPPDPLMSRNILLSSSRLHAWHPQQKEPVNEWERKNDELVNRMAGEFDLVKRKELWGQVLEHHAEYLPMIYLYSSIQYAASTPRVQNLRPSLLRPETFHNLAELWIDE